MEDAHLLGVQEVSGSNPDGPTTELLCFQHPSAFPLIAEDGTVKKLSKNWS